MKLHYRLEKDERGYFAECVESDAMGDGATPEEAIGALRAVLEERMCRPDAVAPPAEAEEVHIELLPMEESEADRAARPMS